MNEKYISADRNMKKNPDCNQTTFSTWFEHTSSSPASAKSFYRPTALSPGTVLAQSCFWAWQDLAGQTLTRPFHARPRKCHLAGVNDYHSNGRVTCSQQEPRSLHLSASHFPCPLFISLQVNYSSCTTRRHKSTAQTLKNCTLSLLI